MKGDNSYAYQRRSDAYFFSSVPDITDRSPNTVDQTERSKYKNELIRLKGLPHPAVEQIHRAVRDTAARTPITGHGPDRAWDPDSGK